MKNQEQEKGFVVTVLLFIIAVLVIGGGAYIYLQEQKSGVPKTPGNQTSGVGNCGLMITSHKANAQVSFPLTISGTVNNTDRESRGCSWSMFEGGAGGAELYYYNNGDWHRLGVPTWIPVTDWMTNKTTFSVTLNFNNEGIGLPPGTLLKVTFTEDNASGIPPTDTYDLPLVLASS